MPRRKRQHGPWFWRSSIGVMLASVLGLFAVIAMNRPPSLMADTACRLDRKDPAHTVMLIDQSDPFSQNDFDWVRELVDTEARSLPRYGKLTVMIPNATSPYQPATVFSACSPGSAAHANPLFQNPQMIEDAWQAEFYTPLIRRVEAALQDQTAESSPLMEALFVIADRADFQPSREHRRLVLVSDLMQHSDGFSFYSAGADYTAFGASRLKAQMPAMRNVEVTARIVPRQNYDLPLADVKTFWRGYFQETGALYGSAG